MSFLHGYEHQKFTGDLMELELLREKAYRWVENRIKIGEAIDLLQYYKDQRQIILILAANRGFDLDELQRVVNLMRKK
jgi:hypothetical protein